MNDEHSASTSTTTTATSTTRRTTTTYWVDGKDGKMPWSKRKLFGLIGLPVMAIGTAIATPWAVDHIEDQLVDEAVADLSAAGIDPSGLDIDFDYRDGEATGLLPVGATIPAAEAAVDDGLLRDFDVLAAEATPEPTAAPEPTEIPVAETGSTDVDAELADGVITLRGDVLTEVQRSTLVDAAAGAVGATNVVDELTITGLDAAFDGADARVGDLAGVLAGLGGASSARLELADDVLRGSIAGLDDASGAALAAAVDGADGDIDLAATTAPLGVEANLTDDRIRLTGEVFSEGQAQALVIASQSVVGFDNVDNELTIAELAPSADQVDERVAALAFAISELDGATAATATLTDTDLTVTATTADPAAAAAIEAIEGAGDLVATQVDVTIDAAPVDAQIDGLQGELDALAGEIRDTVVFATGSNELTAEAQATLDKVVAAMDTYPLPVVEVAGHTDDVGDAALNQALSQDRAAAVEAYLVSAGVDADRVSSRGAGETEPIADNSTEEGRAQNRRVALTALASF